MTARGVAWVVQMGEPMPTDPGTPRLMRSGQLAVALADAGFDTLFWGSRFRYYDKTFRIASPAPLRVADRLSVVHVDSPGYRRNVSIGRLYDHRILARNFAALLSGAQRPDVIHCAFPTIEVADEAVRYARRAGIPVIVDVRDMWPDSFIDQVSPPLRGLASLAIAPLRRRAARTFVHATALTAHTSAFLDFALRGAARAPTPLDMWFPFAYDRTVGRPVDPQAQDWVRQLSCGLQPELRLCFFGNLDSMRADVDFRPLFRAIRALDTSRRARVQFVACGEGRMAAALRREAGGMPEVVFPGWVDAPRIRALLAGSQLGYLPYLPSPDFENSIPNKAVEYLAGGLPIVTSLTRGILAGLLRQSGAGFCIDTTDSASLEMLLRRSIDEPASLEQATRAAQALFSEMFDAERVVGSMVEHVAAVMETSARS